MKELQLVTPIKAMRDDELPETDRTLVMKAREATYSSYAPYSNFHVGAAILLDNGEVVTGSNQENAATPSGLAPTPPASNPTNRFRRAEAAGKPFWNLKSLPEKASA